MARKKTAKPTEWIQDPVQEQASHSGDMQPEAVSIQQVIVVQNRLAYRALQVLTCLAAVVIAVGLLLRTPIIGALLESNHLSRSRAPLIETGLIMYLTGVFATVVALVAFQVLIHRIPLTFITLWKRNVIASPPEGRPEPLTPTTGLRVPLQSASVSLMIRYQLFLQELEKKLNHPGQWLVGVLVMLLVLTWDRNPIDYMNQWGDLAQSSLVVGLVDMFSYFIQYLLAFMIGLLIWRMLILGVYIWRLGKRFDINPKIGHPDACGGLEPLGNLCLWNAMFVSIAGVFLGGWIILAHVLQIPRSDPLYPLLQQALWYAGLFSLLLWIPIAVAVISFFVPLWSIHRAMLAKQSLVKQEMEQLAQAITGLEQTLLEQADTLDTQQADEMTKRLKTMQDVYQRNQQYPVWPFNIKTLAKFASSQVVPALVALGLSDKVADVIRAVLTPASGG